MKKVLWQLRCQETEVDIFVVVNVVTHKYVFVVNKNINVVIGFTMASGGRQSRANRTQ